MSESRHPQINNLVDQALMDIEMALVTVHNTVTTDVVEQEPHPNYSWRINNNREVMALDYLRSIINDRICPVCGEHDKCPSTKQT